MLRSIYFAIFDSHLNYVNLIRAQISNAIQQIIILQKTMRIISFQPQSSHSSPFFQKNNILKFSDKTMIDNIPFIDKALLNNMLPLIFENWFQFYYNIHHESITCTIKGHLHIKSLRANNFGKFSVTVNTIHSLNKMQDQMGEIAVKDIRSS